MIATRLLRAIKVSRTASNFTFATRYPKKVSPSAFSGSKGSKSSNGSKKTKRVPARMRLEASKSSPNSFSGNRFGQNQRIEKNGNSRQNQRNENDSRQNQRNRTFSSQLKKDVADRPRHTRTVKFNRRGQGLSQGDLQGSEVKDEGTGQRNIEMNEDIGHRKMRTSKRNALASNGLHSSMRGASSTRVNGNDSRDGKNASSFNRNDSFIRSTDLDRNAHRATSFDRNTNHSNTSASPLLNKDEEKISFIQKQSLHNLEFQLSTPQSTPITSHSSFSAMLLHPLVLAGLQALGFTKPSQVQQACIPTIMNHGGNVLMGSMTGSGKTIAYLAPVMHFLKTAEDGVTAETLKPVDGVSGVAHEPSMEVDTNLLQAQEVTQVKDSSADLKEIRDEELFEMIESITSDGELITTTSPMQVLRKVGRPRTIIMVPSRQLVTQITQIAKIMSHQCKLRVLGLHGGSKKITEALSTPVDLLIATPNMLQSLLDLKQISFASTRHMVLDEADTLFDKHYQEEIQPLIHTALAAAKSQSLPISFILATATFPRTLDRALSSEFKNVIRLTTPSLHRTPAGLNQQFLRLDGSTTKPNLILDLIKRASASTNRMLIFCNTTESVSDLESHLISKSIRVISMSSSLHPTQQKRDMEQFMDSEDPEFMACVATDMASRGVDTINVGHVVLYDFPQTTIAYLHRVGRTARYGRNGRATSMLMKKDLPLALLIQDSLKARTALSQ